MIFPPSRYTARVTNIPPAGIAKVTGFLRSKGHEVDQDDLHAKAIHLNSSKLLLSQGIDMSILYDEDRVARYLSGQKDQQIDTFVTKTLDTTSLKEYDAICFSVILQWQAYSSMLLAKRIKEIMGVPIIFGGVSSSVIMSEKFISIPVVKSIVEDVRAHKLYRMFEPQEISEQIPDYDGLPLHLYKHKGFGNHFALYYELDTGCLYKCGFCTFRVRKAYHHMDPQKAVMEIEMLQKKYKTNLFELGTDMINSNYDLLHEFCDTLIAKNLGIKWLSFASPAKLDEKTLEKMAASGCHLLKYGIESGSDRILRLMRKPFNIEQASRVLKAGKKVGIYSTINIITGFPHETAEDIKSTINFIFQHEKELDIIRVNRFTLLKSSDMEQHPEQYGIKNIRPINPVDLAFDEIGGLTWSEKRQQINRSFRTIKQASHKAAITMKKLPCYPRPIPRVFPYIMHRYFLALAHQCHALGAYVNSPSWLNMRQKPQHLLPHTTIRPLEFDEIL